MNNPSYMSYFNREKEIQKTKRENLEKKKKNRRKKKKEKLQNEKSQSINPDSNINSLRNSGPINTSDMLVRSRVIGVDANSTLGKSGEIANWFRDHHVQNASDRGFRKDEEFPDLLVEVESVDKGKSYLTNKKPGSSYLNVISKKKKGSKKVDLGGEKPKDEVERNEEEKEKIELKKEEASDLVLTRLVQGQQILVASNVIEKDLSSPKTTKVPVAEVKKNLEKSEIVKLETDKKNSEIQREPSKKKIEREVIVKTITKTIVINKAKGTKEETIKEKIEKNDCFEKEEIKKTKKEIIIPQQSEAKNVPNLESKEEITQTNLENSVNQRSEEIIKIEKLSQSPKLKTDKLENKELKFNDNMLRKNEIDTIENEITTDMKDEEEVKNVEKIDSEQKSQLENQMTNEEEIEKRKKDKRAYRKMIQQSLKVNLKLKKGSGKKDFISRNKKKLIQNKKEIEESKEMQISYTTKQGIKEKTNEKEVNMLSNQQESLSKYKNLKDNKEKKNNKFKKLKPTANHGTSNQSKGLDIDKFLKNISREFGGSGETYQSAPGIENQEDEPRPSNLGSMLIKSHFPIIKENKEEITYQSDSDQGSQSPTKLLHFESENGRGHQRMQSGGYASNYQKNRNNQKKNNLYSSMSKQNLQKDKSRPKQKKKLTEKNSYLKKAVKKNLLSDNNNQYTESDFFDRYYNKAPPSWKKQSEEMENEEDLENIRKSKSGVVQKKKKKKKKKSEKNKKPERDFEDKIVKDDFVGPFKNNFLNEKYDIVEQEAQIEEKVVNASEYLNEKDENPNDLVSSRNVEDQIKQLEQALLKTEEDQEDEANEDYERDFLDQHKKELEEEHLQQNDLLNYIFKDKQNSEEIQNEEFEPTRRNFNSSALINLKKKKKRKLAKKKEIERIEKIEYHSSKKNDDILNKFEDPESSRINPKDFLRAKKYKYKLKTSKMGRVDEVISKNLFMLNDKLKRKGFTNYKMEYESMEGRGEDMSKASPKRKKKKNQKNFIESNKKVKISSKRVGGITKREKFVFGKELKDFDREIWDAPKRVDTGKKKVKKPKKKEKTELDKKKMKNFYLEKQKQEKIKREQREKDLIEKEEERKKQLKKIKMKNKVKKIYESTYHIKKGEQVSMSINQGIKQSNLDEEVEIKDEKEETSKKKDESFIQEIKVEAIEKEMENIMKTLKDEEHEEEIKSIKKVKIEDVIELKKGMKKESSKNETKEQKVIEDIDQKNDDIKSALEKKEVKEKSVKKKKPAKPKINFLERNKQRIAAIKKEKEERLKKEIEEKLLKEKKKKELEKMMSSKRGLILGKMVAKKIKCWRKQEEKHADPELTSAGKNDQTKKPEKEKNSYSQKSKKITAFRKCESKRSITFMGSTSRDPLRKTYSRRNLILKDGIELDSRKKPDLEVVMIEDVKRGRHGLDFGRMREKVKDLQSRETSRNRDWETNKKTARPRTQIIVKSNYYSKSMLRTQDMVGKQRQREIERAIEEEKRKQEEQIKREEEAKLEKETEILAEVDKILNGDFQNEEMEGDFDNIALKKKEQSESEGKSEEVSIHEDSEQNEMVNNLEKREINNKIHERKGTFSSSEGSEIEEEVLQKSMNEDLNEEKANRSVKIESTKDEKEDKEKVVTNLLLSDDSQYFYRLQDLIQSSLQIEEEKPKNNVIVSILDVEKPPEETNETLNTSKTSIEVSEELQTPIKEEEEYNSELDMSQSKTSELIVAVKGAEKYIERQKKTREKDSKQIHSYPTGGIYIPSKREEKLKEELIEARKKSSVFNKKSTKGIQYNRV